METKIILGDAFELIKSIPDQSVDLVLTSPPYGIGKEYEKRSKNVDEYIEGFIPLLDEIKRVLKPTGSVCWQVGNRIEGASHEHKASESKSKPAPETYPLEFYFYFEFKKLGFLLRNNIAWVSRNTIPFRDQKFLTGQHEAVLWFTKGDDYYCDIDSIRVPQKYPDKKYFYKDGNYTRVRFPNPKGKNPGDAWEIVLSTHSNERWDHPAQFPEELVRRLILMSCPVGGTVLDPFAGVATTLKVAQDLERVGIGFEKEPKYYNQALLRLNGVDQKGQMSLDTDWKKVMDESLGSFGPKGEEKNGNSEKSIG